MQCRLYDIDLQLKPFVKVICSMESDVPIVSPAPLRVLPDTYVELFVNYGQPQHVHYTKGISSPQSRCFITARMNRFMDVQSSGTVGFISICFFAGSAYPFFPVSMHDMANQVIDLRDIWGPDADDMQDRVDTAKTAIQRVQLIQYYLIQRLQKAGKLDSGIHFCIRQIKGTNGQLSLAELARQTGISNRQLVRRFNQCVGLSPKEFTRIITFKNALKQLKKYPLLSLTEIAYESTYYDQAHFIHACREYADLTPGQLVAKTNVLY